MAQSKIDIALKQLEAMKMKSPVQRPIRQKRYPTPSASSKVRNNKRSTNLLVLVRFSFNILPYS